jgi:plastocyanin
MGVRITAVILLACGLACARAWGSEVVVVQKDKAFVPRSVTIKPGDTVVFKNEDGVTHNAFSENRGLEFNVRAQAPGGSDAITFANEGTAEVRCAFHPAMRMTITVKK